MIDIVKKFFGKPSPVDTAIDHQTGEHDLYVAVCALCIEIARIDNEFTPQELDAL